MRRESLRTEAAQRSRVRRVERRARRGTLRFVALALAIIVTAVLVTIVMFETLAGCWPARAQAALAARGAVRWASLELPQRLVHLLRSSAGSRRAWISR